MKKPKGRPASFYLVNGITLYRLVSAPFLLWLAAVGHIDAFKWLLALSFFTDAIDGFLSRRLKVASLFGAKLDSIADDATVLVATIGLWIVYPDFVARHWLVLILLLLLFAIQNAMALYRYRRVTNFHTYLAKTAAVSPGIFFLLIFFELGYELPAFFVAAAVTGLQLIEDIALVAILPEWKANVGGVIRVLRQKRRRHRR